MSQTLSETSYLPATMPLDGDKEADKARKDKKAKKAEKAEKARKAKEAKQARKADKAREAEEDAGEGGVTFTIDELAAETHVASRTIRFYQAKGILERPHRKGRKAFYTDQHVSRLKLIAKLQDRGLRIRGMRQLLARRDSEAAVSEWLGLEDKLSAPWSNERARALDETEITELIGDRPAGTLAALVDAGLVERRDDPPKTFLVPSPGLLEVGLRLFDSGIGLDVLAEIEPIVREGLRQAAEGVVDYFVGEGGLGQPGDEQKLTQALDALRTQGANAVSIIFAQEIERTLRSLLDEGRPAKRRRRRPTRRR